MLVLLVLMHHGPDAANVTTDTAACHAAGLHETAKGAIELELPLMELVELVLLLLLRGMGRRRRLRMRRRSRRRVVEGLGMREVLVLLLLVELLLLLLVVRNLLMLEYRVNVVAVLVVHLMRADDSIGPGVAFPPPSVCLAAIDFPAPSVQRCGMRMLPISPLGQDWRRFSMGARGGARVFPRLQHSHVTHRRLGQAVGRRAKGYGGDTGEGLWR